MSWLLFASVGLISAAFVVALLLAADFVHRRYFRD